MTTGQTAKTAPPEEDLTGRDRLTSNVLFSWGGHLVFAIAGFVMPRLIDNHIGQFSLGIWDFCWSLVNYMSMMSLGIGSSVNRYVAKYRANHDVENLCKAVSSVALIQIGVAVLVALCTLALLVSFPSLFSHRFGTELHTVQWVVFFLGMSLAIQMLFDPFRGVMTGCHRWDLHNGINALSYALTVIVMVVSLFLHGGLRHLAAIYFISSVLTELFRMNSAHRICPELRIRWAYVDRHQTKRMFAFGGKAVVAGLSPLIIVQTVSVLIVGALGPAALAVFSRPIALVRNIETVMNKFAFVTTPTAGALQGQRHMEDIREFLVQSTRYGIAVTLPLSIVLLVFGDTILEVWMGPNYANGTVMGILALGYVLAVSQNSVIRILMGINLHGMIGFLSLGVTLAIFGIGVLVVHFTGWNLTHAALLVAVPLAIGNGLLVPAYACRKLRIPGTFYIRAVFLQPVLCAIPFGAILILSRLLFGSHPLTALGCGIGVGGVILGLLYWRYLIPERMRRMFVNFAQEKLILFKPTSGTKT